MVCDGAEKEARRAKNGKVVILDARLGQPRLNNTDAKDNVLTSRRLSQHNEPVQTSANKARRATRTMLGLTLCEMSNQIGKIPCPLGRFLRLAADLVEVFSRGFQARLQRNTCSATKSQ